MKMRYNMKGSDKSHFSSTKTTIKISVKFALSVLFIFCLFEMSYGYYQAVRFLGMAGFVWLAYTDNERKEKSLVIVWVLSALLINPFIKVPLGRTIWNIADIIWAIILIITICIDLISWRKGKLQNSASRHL